MIGSDICHMHLICNIFTSLSIFPHTFGNTYSLSTSFLVLRPCCSLDRIFELHTLTLARSTSTWKLSVWCPSFTIMKYRVHGLKLSDCIWELCDLVFTGCWQISAQCKYHLQQHCPSRLHIRCVCISHFQLSFLP